MKPATNINQSPAPQAEETPSSTKKVTLLSALDLYEIDIFEFS